MKEYFELDGVKYTIKERSMQLQHPKKTPFKKKERVTFELIVLCLFAAFSWSAFMYSLIYWMS